MVHSKLIKNRKKRFLVIGYGSIGSKHCKLLAKQGHEIAVVSQREDCPFLCFTDIFTALKKFSAEIIIVSNRTVDHVSALQSIGRLQFGGLVLVEKPLFDKLSRVEAIIELPQIFIAYNLRFHPIVQRIKHLLQDRVIYSAQFYVGQYLPTWRPGSDYRKGYSSFKSQGGGVLRDLSHELDMAQWIAGRWKRVAALGGKFSDLEIDSEDLFSLLIETERSPIVSIQVNYLDRCSRREIVINADGVSIKADLIAQSLTINDTVASFKVDKDETYLKQLEAMVQGNYTDMCSYLDGLEVVNLIEASEKAAKEKIWISRI